MRDSRQRVYVPGSSVKGALRTVILSALIAQEKKGSRPDRSILRDLSVSDSEVVPDAAMILSGKSDVNTRGEEKKLPLCRECIRPGTELRFRLTLDHSVLPEVFSAAGRAFSQNRLRIRTSARRSECSARRKPWSDSSPGTVTKATPDSIIFLRT